MRGYINPKMVETENKGEREEQMIFVEKEVKDYKKNESMRRKHFAIPNQVGVTD